MKYTKQLRCPVIVNEEENKKNPSSQNILFDSLDNLSSGLDDLDNILKNHFNIGNCKTSFLEEQQLKKEVLQAINRETARAFVKLTKVHKQLKDNSIYNKDK